MLMRFSINNFMSIPYNEDKDGNMEPTEFAMYAGRTEQFKERVTSFKERKVLKFSSIYGANAAGKSNLIHAIECGKRIIVEGMDFPDLKERYCRNVKTNREKPTLFEYEFSVGNRCFAYGFTVNLFEQKVLTEWLTELDNTKENTIFERDAEHAMYFFDEDFFSTEENVQQFHFFIKDANRVGTSLLLYELERRHLEEEDFKIFQEIFDWFQKSLTIIYPYTKIGASYFRFGTGNAELIKILQYLDTGITGYKMQSLNETAFREYFSDYELADKFLRKGASEVSLKGKSILKYKKTLFELEFNENGVEKISKLLFQHGNSDALYEYGEESDGTQRLIELLEVILNDDEGKTFVMDELDRSLHPQMTKKFVETFFRFSKNLKTQLITTTHESNLMDLKLLRRDEIWFAERNDDYSTVLYPLEKFKTRYDTVVSKAYLSGRYGAVPVFKDFDYVWGRNES